jgi:ribosomal protein S12 methylthiotransferase accessory factor
MTLAAAAQSAIRELCQIELAYVVVEAKREESGEAALNEHDLRHLERSAGIDPEACALLHPMPPPRMRAEPPNDLDDARALDILVDRLMKMQIEVLAVDLTRKMFDIPVARVIAPGLQLEPSDMSTQRLASTITRTGGGEMHTRGVALL